MVHLSLSNKHHERKHSLTSWVRRKTGQNPQGLCPDCFDLELRNDEIADPNSHYTKRLEARLLSQRMVKDVVRTAKSGCSACRFFCTILAGAAPSPANLELSHQDSNVLDSRLILTQEDTATITIRVPGPPGHVDKRWLSLDVCEVETVLQDEQLIVRNLEQHIGEDEFCDCHKTNDSFPRLICEDPLSPEGCESVSRWMKLCSTHECCVPVQDHPLPSRVVDVENPDKPKLLQTGGQHGQYVILSHCWGQVPHMTKSTKALVSEFEKFIDPTSLPPTFQDAIVATHKFGFRYVWIDALCIVQDDPSDWNQEAAKMADYYARSALMISASESTSCEVSFATPRAKMISPVLGKDPKFCLRPRLATHANQISHLPITCRAWTLQERYLAPRVLHFFTEQMHFECGSRTYMEAYLRRVTYDHEDTSKESIQYIVEREHYSKAANEEHQNNMLWYRSDHEFQLRLWYRFVHKFTARAITYQSDRLPAIAGMASRFADPHWGEYMAGLWEFDLFRGMSWIKAPEWLEHRHRKATFSTELGNDAFVAPSWSWASFNGTVMFDTSSLPGADMEGLYTPIFQFNEKWRTAYGPILVRKHLISSSTSNAYFNVLEGSYIEVDGYCRPVQLKPVGPDFEHPRPLNKPSNQIDHVYLDHAPSGQNDKFVLIFDESDESAVDELNSKFVLDISERSSVESDNANVEAKPQQRKQLVVLQISIVREESVYSDVYGLILELQDDQSSYKRVGICGLHKYEHMPCLMRSEEPSSGDPKNEAEDPELYKEKWTKQVLRLV